LQVTFVVFAVVTTGPHASWAVQAMSQSGAAHVTREHARYALQASLHGPVPAQVTSPHASCPLQSRPQLDPVQLSGPRHARYLEQVMSQVLLAHETAPHASCPSHVTLQRDDGVPQSRLPAHDR
jgi:hypothetical protein